MKVLIIEDDSAIVEAVSLAFQVGWSEADIVYTRLGEEGVDLADSESPDIVILDLGLPDISGFETLKRIRLFSAVPIIILSVRAEEKDIVKALEWGANDYITKPFRQLELLARVKAATRRQQLVDKEITLDCGGFIFYVSANKIKRNSIVTELTNTESLILYHLRINRGRIVTHSELAERIWGDDYPGATEAIRVHIKNLRRKIEKTPSQPVFIISKPGFGYLFSQ